MKHLILQSSDCFLTLHHFTDSEILPPATGTMEAFLREKDSEDAEHSMHTHAEKSEV